MKIALLCPTRERLGHIKRLKRSIERTVHSIDNIALYIGVDFDDVKTLKEIQLLCQFNSWVKIIKLQEYGKWPGLGVIWNELAAVAPEEIFAMVGDDFIFKTYGWDHKILKEFINGPRDKILMVHCNDGIHGPGNKYSNSYGLKPGRVLAVNPFIHRKYYELNGYYLRNEFKHQFLDTWLDNTFHTIGRKIYRHDIMIQHLHFSQINIVDNVTLNLRQRSVYNTEKLLFAKMVQDRELEISRLKEYITKLKI